ncbi:hypothetical protein ACFQYP_64840 [Nonomuraea antimicrobica]
MHDPVDGCLNGTVGAPGAAKHELQGRGTVEEAGVGAGADAAGDCLGE